MSFYRVNFHDIALCQVAELPYGNGNKTQKIFKKADIKKSAEESHEESREEDRQEESHEKSCQEESCEKSRQKESREESREEESCEESCQESIPLAQSVVGDQRCGWNSSISRKDTAKRPFAGAW